MSSPSPGASPSKRRSGIERVVWATRYSLQGVAAAWRHEAAFRQEVLIAVALAPVAVWLARTPLELLLLLGSLLLVLIVELVNSALEAIADAVRTERDPLLGRAKDFGSAAVMLALLLAGATWLVVVLGR